MAGCVIISPFHVVKDYPSVIWSLNSEVNGAVAEVVINLSPPIDASILAPEGSDLKCQKLPALRKVDEALLIGRNAAVSIENSPGVGGMIGGKIVAYNDESATIEILSKFSQQGISGAPIWVDGVLIGIAIGVDTANLNHVKVLRLDKIVRQAGQRIFQFVSGSITKLNIRSFYESDFKDIPRMIVANNVEIKRFGTNEIVNLEIDVTILNDFESGSEYYAFYVDNISDINLIGKNYKKIIELVRPNIGWTKHRDQDKTPINAKTLLFTGRIYIYCRERITPDIVVFMTNLFKESGASVVIRSDEYVNFKISETLRSP